MQSASLLADCMEAEHKPEQAQKYRDLWKDIKARQKLVNDLDAEVARNPRNLELRARMAQLLFEQGNGAEGLRWLESAVREDADFVVPEKTYTALRKYYEQSKDPAALVYLDRSATAP
jgi:hypothetical protein